MVGYGELLNRMHGAGACEASVTLIKWCEANIPFDELCRFLISPNSSSICVDLDIDQEIYPPDCVTWALRRGWISNIDWSLVAELDAYDMVNYVLCNRNNLNQFHELTDESKFYIYNRVLTHCALGISPATIASQGWWFNLCSLQSGDLFKARGGVYKFDCIYNNEVVAYRYINPEKVSMVHTFIPGGAVRES